MKKLLLATTATMLLTGAANAGSGQDLICSKMGSDSMVAFCHNAFAAEREAGYDEGLSVGESFVTERAEANINAARSERDAANDHAAAVESELAATKVLLSNANYQLENIEGQEPEIVYVTNNVEVIKEVEVEKIVEVEVEKIVEVGVPADVAAEQVNDAYAAGHAAAIEMVAVPIYAHKNRAGDTFVKNPVGWMTFAMGYIEDMQRKLSLR